MKAEEIAYAYHFRASPDTVGRASRAFLRWTFLKGPRRGVLPVMSLATALVLFLVTSGSGSIPDRLYFAAFWAVTYVLILGLLCAVIISLTCRKNFRLTVPAGADIQTGFGRDAFVTANERTTSRISYAAVQSITEHGDFVFMRLVGNPLVHLYPRELFPPEAIDRMQRAVADRP